MNPLPWSPLIRTTVLTMGVACFAVRMPVRAQTNLPAPSLNFGPLLPISTYEDLPIRNLPLSLVASSAEPQRIRVDAFEPGGGVTPKFADLRIEGSGLDWRLSLVPGSNLIGTAQVVLRLLYGDREMIRTNLSIRIIPVEDAPQLAPISDVTVTRGEGAPPILLTVTDPDLLLSPALKFEFRTSNSNLLDVANLRPVSAAGGRYSLPLTPRPGVVGSATVVARVTQTVSPNPAITNGGPGSTQSFVLTVRPERFESRSTFIGPSGGAGIPVSADFGGPGGVLTWVPGAGLSAPAEYLPASVTPANISSAFLGDFDGDGRPDLLLSNPRSQEVQVWVNTSDASTNRFQLLSQFPLTDPTATVSATGPLGGLVDFDGDGDLDFLGRTGNESAILFENRGGGREFKPRVLNIVAGTEVVIADFDDDGRPDLLTYNPGSYAFQERGSARLYRNRGDGTFELSSARFPLQRGAPDFAEEVAKAGTADFDGDGRLDLWFTLIWRNRLWLAVFLNRQNLTFENTWLHPLAPENYTERNLRQIGACVSDFDGDGIADILAFKYERQDASGAFLGYQRSMQALFRSLGDGQFAPEEFGLPDTSTPSWVGLADFDRDGNIDPVVSRQIGASRRFLNQTRSMNALPGAPGSLQGTWDGSRLTLSWNDAPDGNQSAPLTYDVRVGTAPGLGNIQATMADAATGQRRAWAPGNTGYRRTLILTPPPERLQGGTHFYWSVQAIDASLAGGAFAPEASLPIPSAIRNEAPTLLPISDVQLGTLNAAQVQTYYGDDHTPSAAIQLQVRLSRPDLLTANQATRFTENQQLTFSVVRVGALGGTCEVTVTAIDSDGQSSSRTFRVTLPDRADGGNALPPGLLGFATTAAGDMLLQADEGDPEAIWESSTDLVHWSTEVLPAPTGDGTRSIQTSEPVRFYRRFRR